jgi:hypothetical protein
MSERKVLNKYYPPDFDASKLPRVKRDKNRQFTIRLMAPFNMRCKTCGEYIYRGKKFNARKEDVIGKTYLGIQIYRFYIKCTKCLAEITFLTDPENQDYEMENGAMRNFESIRLAEKQAEIEEKQKKEEEVNNPMKILENRTRDSRREMAFLETLEDLRELNAANNTIDPKAILEAEEEYKKQLEILQKEEDEAEVKRILSRDNPIKPKVLEEIVLKEDEVDSETSEKISIKHKLEDTAQLDSELSENKKQKIEASILFPKPVSYQSQPPKISELGQMSKSNISLFIKKKPLSIKSEPIEQDKDKDKQKSQIGANALSNLLSAYGDDDDDDCA